MDKIKIDHKVVIEKEVKKFGHSGHVLVPKDLVGKKVLIVKSDVETERGG